MIRRAAALGLATAALAAPLVTVPTAHADPCFFTNSEFVSWYDGPRWGASLSTVQDKFANCDGAWGQGGEVIGSWYGHDLKQRVWPKQNGDTITINFAHYDSAPTWRAHDEAVNGYDGPNGPNVYYEWPRP
jgi:hypothetical protein